MNEPVAICTFLIIAATVYASYRGFKEAAFRERFVFDSLAVLRGREYHRLVTSAFLHGDMPHLAFNMISLYLFGRDIELLFGRHTLLLIYFAAIVGGSLLSLYLHRSHEYRALGASGGVCGVIFASIFLLPGGRIIVFPLPFPIPAWLYAILFVVASFVGMRRRADNIGHDAHLGGAIIGLLMATALRPSIVADSPRLYAAIMGLSLAAMAYGYRRPLHSTAPGPATGTGWGEAVARVRDKARARKEANDEEELDRLLAKISQSGMASLSQAERKRLAVISERKRAGKRHA